MIHYGKDSKREKLIEILHKKFADDLSKAKFFLPLQVLKMFTESNNNESRSQI